MVDVLSCKRHELLVMTLSMDLRIHILKLLPLDAWYQEVRAEIDSGRVIEGIYVGYSLELDVLLCHLGHIYVLSSEGLHTFILIEAHHAPYSTHPGVEKMHVDLQQFYHWLGMRCDIVDFVS